MNQNIEYELEKIREEAYRRGYNHGFHFGSVCPEEKIEKTKYEILEWKDNLEIMTGGPGSKFENFEMKWTLNHKRLKADFKE